jgi:hypothetical protein
MAIRRFPPPLSVEGQWCRTGACGGPLHGREGRFLLKYFMIERPKRRAAGY